MRPPTPLPVKPINISPRSGSSNIVPDFYDLQSPPHSPTTPLASSPPRSSPLNPHTPPSPTHATPPRRRYSQSSPLVGSFSSSILAMRMPSAALAPELTFSARIRLSSNVPAFTLSFVAQFYSIASPYVGDITLPSSYPIPSKGQVQLVILNPENQPLKAFVVPYDARALKLGERTYVRQTCYAPSHDGSKDLLRYAVQLQFSSEAAAEPVDESQTQLPFEMDMDIPRRQTSPRKLKKRVHLCPSVRVVFASRTSDDEGPLRTQTESAALPVSGASHMRRSSLSAMDQDDALSNMFIRKSSHGRSTRDSIDEPQASVLRASAFATPDRIVGLTKLAPSTSATYGLGLPFSLDTKPPTGARSPPARDACPLPGDPSVFGPAEDEREWNDDVVMR